VDPEGAPEESEPLVPSSLEVHAASTTAAASTKATVRIHRMAEFSNPVPPVDDYETLTRGGVGLRVRTLTGGHGVSEGSWDDGWMELIIEATQVRKVYHGATDVEALRGVDVQIARGEMAAIMGPSGSGKTTLLNCLSGLEQIDAGQILVDGRDLAALSDDARTEWRGRSMGFIFQAFNLLPVLTAAENVEIPLLLTGTRPKKARARAIEILEEVGLGDRTRHRPDQLSGGEQQRVAVARALVHEPSVVWADEPTGNLDSESAEHVMELLGRMNDNGQTIVIVTHANEVAAHTTRTIHVRDGVIADGSLEADPPVDAKLARADRS